MTAYENKIFVMTKTNISFTAVLISTVFLFFFASCSTPSEKKDRTITRSIMEKTWVEFRQLHPGSFHTIGLRHYGDTCVFVVSEPPSWVTTHELEQKFTQYGGDFVVGQYKLGYDGVLCDAVGCAVLDSFAFSHLERDLFSLIYKTDYKPYYTDLDTSSPHIFFSPVNLDFKISDNDLYNWIKNEKFTGPDLKDVSVEDLLSSDTSTGIYYSKAPGFLIWKLCPASIPVSLAEARRFTLDSDLIAGAIEGDGCVLTVAREREIPVTILPPLSIETIACICNNEIDDCDIWMPASEATYVDDSIWGTPFITDEKLRTLDIGVLLTTIDEMLKSWCENGQTHDLFSTSPIPLHFPFNDGISSFLKSSPTCSWIIPKTSDKVLTHTVLRTGSISPTFMDGNNPSDNKKNKAKNIAHEWFASLSQTDLVRLSQYLFLYSVFHTAMSLNDRTSNTTDTSSGWIMAPSLSVSNHPWLNGGCISLLPIKPPRIKPHSLPQPHIHTPRPPQPRLPSPTIAPALRTIPVTFNRFQHPSTKETPPKPYIQPVIKQLTSKHANKSKPRSSFISTPETERNAQERGFIPARHNIIPDAATTIQLQESPNLNNQVQPDWKDRLRQKIKDKIHKINLFEMQTDQYIIFGKIKKHDNGTYLITTPEAHSISHITSSEQRICA